MARLEATTGFDIGFPNNFIRDRQSFVYGEVGAQVEGIAAGPVVDRVLDAHHVTESITWWLWRAH